MKLISLKVKDDILLQSEEIIEQMHVSRNEYINQALLWFNKFNRRRNIKKILIKEAELIKESSMKVLKEMESLDG